MTTCKKNNNISLKIVKNVLKGLKNELEITFNNNIQNQINMEKKTKTIKSFLKKNIFEKGQLNNHRLKKAENKREVNIKFNQKFIGELPHLKILNFQAENLIIYMDIKIKLLSDNVLNLKKLQKLKYFFWDGKNDLSNAYNLLHEKLISIRNKFKLIVKYQEKQNIDILKLRREIISLKKKYFLQLNNFKKEYINSNEIINEESKEYNTKTDVYTIENSNDNKDDCKNLNENFIYKNKLKSINNNI